MRTLTRITAIAGVCVMCLTCKKSTDIKITLFNYSLGEPVANAQVALVERKEGALFSKNDGCTEIAHATTDADGVCHFNSEKLRKNKAYDYFVGVTNAYGMAQFYPCEGKTSGFIDKGGSQEQTLNSGEFDGFLIVKENNLLSPSSPSDSIYIHILSDYYTIPDHSQGGGGGVLNAYSYYGDKGYPYPSELTSNPIKTPCGIKTVHVRKRKMGVVSVSDDKVKVYPNQTATVTINW